MTFTLFLIAGVVLAFAANKMLFTETNAIAKLRANYGPEAVLLRLALGAACIVGGMLALLNAFDATSFTVRQTLSSASAVFLLCFCLARPLKSRLVQLAHLPFKRS